ncbi:MAG: hypothetical protein V3R77_03310 [Candidatus Binatia bacterium]
MPGIVRAIRAISITTGLFGVAAVLAPKMTGDIVGLTVEVGNSNGYGEIGAMYGGVSIALGILGVWATLPGRTGGRSLLGAVGLLWGCIALCRLIVMTLIEPASAGLIGWASFLLEAGLAAVFGFLRTAIDDA